MRLFSIGLLSARDAPCDDENLVYMSFSWRIPPKNLRRWRSRRFAYVAGMTGADVFSLWVAKDREVSWAGPSFAKIEGKETSDGYFALHL